MKKALSLLLACLLAAGCAGCGKAPVFSETGSAPASSPSASAQPENASGLRFAAAEQEDCLFYLDCPESPAPKATLMRVDYAAKEARPFCGKAGCTHRSEDCPAHFDLDSYVWNMGVAVLNENTVALVLNLSSQAGYQIRLVDREGGGSTLLAEDSADGDSRWVFSSQLAAFDETHLYYLVVWESLEDESRPRMTGEMFRVPLAGGEPEKLYDLPLAQIVGLVDGQLLGMVHYLDDPDGENRYYAIDPKTGETRELFSYTDEGLLDMHKSLFAEDTFYHIQFPLFNAEHSDQLPIDWVRITGETGQLSFALPAEMINASYVDVELETVLDGQLILTLLADTPASRPHRFAIDLASGTSQELTLSFLDDGVECPVEIKAKTADSLLVVFERSQLPGEALDEKGIPTTEEQTHERWGLLSQTDFFHNVPNYSEIAWL